MKRTGEDVPDPGLYYSDCCLEEVILAAGDSFPRCKRCSGLAEWELVDLPSQQAA
jgi:hypothetical protein